MSLEFTGFRVCCSRGFTGLSIVGQKKFLLSERENKIWRFVIRYILRSDYLPSYVVVSILHRQTMIEQYLLIIRKKVNSDLLVVAKIFKYSLQ